MIQQLDLIFFSTFQINKSNYLQTLVLLIGALKIFLYGTFEVNFNSIFIKKY